MSEIIYVRGNCNSIEYGKGEVSNAGYVASRSADAQKLIADLLAHSSTYDWKTTAGSNLCAQMDIDYCKVTENRYHDYLPVYRLSWTANVTNEEKELYSDDFIDIVAEILRRWW